MMVEGILGVWAAVVPYPSLGGGELADVHTFEKRCAGEDARENGIKKQSGIDDEEKKLIVSGFEEGESDFDEFEIALPVNGINVAEDVFFLDAISEAEWGEDALAVAEGVFFPETACVQRPRRRRRRGRGPFRRRPLPTR
eukprot:14946561-Alexandrium_andersonii.AAC.1